MGTVTIPWPANSCTFVAERSLSIFFSNFTVIGKTQPVMRNPTGLVLLWIGIHIQFTLASILGQNKETPVCPNGVRQPVIIDTDVGSFMDDTAAILLAIQHPCIDVKLIVTASDDTTSRAKVTAKLLTLAGHDHIPIGIGVPSANITPHTLFSWAESFELSLYSGGIYNDGVKIMAELILSSIVDIIAIGPMTNFPQLLDRFPDVVNNTRIRAMAGSINKGYDNSSTPAAEYNVRLCPDCMSKLLEAGWEVSMTPLDTCRQANIPAFQMEKLLAVSNRISLAFSVSYLSVCTSDINPYGRCDPKGSPFPLFDTVAVLLALSNAKEFITFKELNISVTASGFTKVDDTSGTPTQVALSWKNSSSIELFEEYMTNILCENHNAPVPKSSFSESNHCPSR